MVGMFFLINRPTINGGVPKGFVFNKCNASINSMLQSIPFGRTVRYDKTVAVREKFLDLREYLLDDHSLI